MKFRLFNQFAEVESAMADPAAREFYAVLERMRQAVRAGEPSWASYHELVDYARITFWAMRKLEYSCAARICSEVEATVQRPLRILDVGCGVVPFCNWLSRRGHLVTAIDPDEDVIEFLKANNINAFYESDVEFQVGRGEVLGFPDEFFDVVTCVSVLEHVTPGNDQLALNEMGRVLKPGGTLAISFDVGPRPERRAGERPWPDDLRRYAEPFALAAIERLLRGITGSFDVDETSLPQELYGLDWSQVDEFWRAAQEHDGRTEPIRGYLALGGALVRRSQLRPPLADEVIAAYQEGQAALHERLMYFQAHAAERDELVQRLDRKGEDLRAQLDDKEQLVIRLNEEGEVLRAEVEEKDQLVLELNAKAEALRADLMGKDREMADIYTRAETMRADLLGKEREIDDLYASAEVMRSELLAKERELADIYAAAEERRELVVRAQGELTELRAAIGERSQQTEVSEMPAVALPVRETPTRISLHGLLRDRTRHIRHRWYVLTSPRIGVLHQYEPRKIEIPTWYAKRPRLLSPPLISLVTPSLNQGRFVERTLTSVLSQDYPRLEYVIQDGGSTDESIEIFDRYRPSLTDVVVESDDGFGQAINRGFRKTRGEILAYLNSDDMLLPGTLHYVADYFACHPEVDVVYGHRVIIDTFDGEVGRWVLPPHDDEVLSWADYVPQETLFWRRRIWDKVGAEIDESFRFAIDWDLLLRFRAAGANMKRLPRFLGAFRIHAQQKTSAVMHDTGMSEMNLLRARSLGREVGTHEISVALAPYLRRHFIHHKLYRLGILRY